MKITVTLTRHDLDEADCESVEQFKTKFLHQLNEGVIDEEGNNGEDWLPGFTVDVLLVD